MSKRQDFALLYFVRIKNHFIRGKTDKAARSSGLNFNDPVAFFISGC